MQLHIKKISQSDNDTSQICGDKIDQHNLKLTTCKKPKENRKEKKKIEKGRGTRRGKSYYSLIWSVDDANVGTGELAKKLSRKSLSRLRNGVADDERSITTGRARRSAIVVGSTIVYQMGLMML